MTALPYNETPLPMFNNLPKHFLNWTDMKWLLGLAATFYEREPLESLKPLYSTLCKELFAFSLWHWTAARQCVYIQNVVVGGFILWWVDQRTGRNT